MHSEETKTYICASMLIRNLKRGETTLLVSPSYENAAQVLKIVREALNVPQGPVPGLTVQVDDP